MRSLRSLIIILTFVGFACDSDPISQPPVDIPEIEIGDMVVSFRSTATTGDPGYTALVTGSCETPGTNTKVDLFYIRSVPNELVNRTITRPGVNHVADSVSVVITRNQTLKLFCSSTAGFTVEKELQFSGNLPIIGVDSLAPLELDEDTVFRRKVSGFVSHEDNFIAYDLANGVSIVVTEVAGSDVDEIRFTPHNDVNGNFRANFQAQNGFGTTRESIDGWIRPITDLRAKYRVGGALYSVAASAELYSADWQLLDTWTVPAPGSETQNVEYGIETAWLVARHSSSNMFSRTNELTFREGLDVTLNSNFYETQWCRAIFHANPDPLRVCRDVIAETFFTHSIGEREGFKTFFEYGTIQVAQTNPVTGESFSPAMMAAIRALAQAAPLKPRMINDSYVPLSSDFSEALDSTLTFLEAGLTIYPTSGSETNFKYATREGEKDILGTSLGLPSTADPSQFSAELSMRFGYAVLGMQSGLLFENLGIEQQQQFVEKVGSILRWNASDGFGIRSGELVEHVFGLPQDN